MQSILIGKAAAFPNPGRKVIEVEGRLVACHLYNSAGASVGRPPLSSCARADQSTRRAGA